MEAVEKIDVVLNSISQILSCDQCGTRLRFGDLECPHCGEDLEEFLHLWAENMLNRLDGAPSQEA